MANLYYYDIDKEEVLNESSLKRSRLLDNNYLKHSMEKYKRFAEKSIQWT